MTVITEESLIEIRKLAEQLASKNLVSRLIELDSEWTKDSPVLKGWIPVLLLMDSLKLPIAKLLVQLDMDFAKEKLTSTITQHKEEPNDSN